MLIVSLKKNISHTLSFLLVEERGDKKGERALESEKYTGREEERDNMSVPLYSRRERLSLV